MQALNNATGGETIILANGNYGELLIKDTIYNDYVTIQAASAGNVTFNGIRVQDTAYLNIDSVIVA
jgi:hypothetical protein